MVRGIEKFREYFAPFSEHYVIIGGVACTVVMDELAVNFRATKDFDIVLVADMNSDEFHNTFWKFIKHGGYKNKERSNGKPQFFRFTKPDDEDYPFMIELFSAKLAEFKISSDSVLTPIPTDKEIDSLSAILLEEDYYQLVKSGKRIVSGLSVLSEEYLMLFKMKAYVDLKTKKQAGEKVDSSIIKKHKNDVFRLLTIVSMEEGISLDSKIQQDVQLFINLVMTDMVNLHHLGITQITLDDAFLMIRSKFLLD